MFICVIYGCLRLHPKFLAQLKLATDSNKSRPEGTRRLSTSRRVPSGRDLLLSVAGFIPAEKPPESGLYLI